MAVNTWNATLSLWLLVAGYYGVAAMKDGSVSSLRSGSINNNVGLEEQQGHRALDSMMVPGPRVAGMDRATAICSATYNYDLSVSMEETVIEYYYAIESTDNITVKDVEGSMLVRNLEETLFHAIHPAILWCYYDDSTIGKRNLEASSEDIHGRRMTLEEARRLSIVTFSTTPEDEETTSTYIFAGQQLAGISYQCKKTHNLSCS